MRFSVPEMKPESIPRSDCGRGGAVVVGVGASSEMAGPHIPFSSHSSTMTIGMARERSV